MSASAMRLAAGSRLGPYEVVSALGAGGMGEVYMARDTRLGRTVAVKVLPERLSSDAELRQRFEREARTVSQLSHPHICALYDVGHQDGTDFLVMEYLEGQTLAERLAKGPLPLDQVLRFGIEITDALEKAHRSGIVHRDLKPGNVMLTKSGVKLLDFGLAKALGPAPEATILTSLPTQTPLTEKGAILGTVQYMAPEQLEGKEADSRADIFALGTLLYEMATGKKAFAGANQASLISSIMREDPAPISQSQPLAPPMLDRIVKTCLAKNRDERWRDAQDVGVQLQWLEKDLEGFQGRRSDQRSQSIRVVHAAWAAALIAVAVLSWALGRSSQRVSVSAPNPQPVVVLMDSPLPGRVYDARTRAAGGTNADDLTDALSNLPLVIHKETTSAAWHREDQVLRQNPDLIVSHLSCLFDERVGEGQEEIQEEFFSLAANRLILFFGYVAEANPRTRFIVYSRGQFPDPDRERSWIAASEARLPVLRGRLYTFPVPGGVEKATFRDPETVRQMRARVAAVLGLS